MDWSRTVKTLGRFERVLLGVGFLLLAVYLAARIESAVSSRAELRRFWAAQKTAVQVQGAARNTSPLNRESPDFRLWSQKRIAAYRMSFSSAAPIPLAVLKIPAINLEVPVLEGTDDLALNRAVGHIEGTAGPAGDGNIGIAGHRDGFFRGLKDINRGDTIELRRVCKGQCERLRLHASPSEISEDAVDYEIVISCGSQMTNLIARKVPARSLSAAIRPRLANHWSDRALPPVPPQPRRSWRHLANLW
jgi:hypothetical protein